MKLFSIFSIGAALVMAGCATHRDLATLRGEGTRRVYAADFDPVWRAAVDAAQQDGLQVVTADRDHGYIAARRATQPIAFGENVGIWVRQTAPVTTEAEVVSRDPAPPALSLKTWENQIQRVIAANLTRETTAVGAAPRQVIIEQGNGTSTVVVPRNGETVVVPPSTLMGSMFAPPSAPVNLILNVTAVNGPAAGVVAATDTCTFPEPNRVFSAGASAELVKAFSAERLVIAFGSQTTVCGKTPSP